MGRERRRSEGTFTRKVRLFSLFPSQLALPLSFAIASSFVVSPTPRRRIYSCETVPPSSVSNADPSPPFLPRPAGGYEHDEVPVVDFTASAAPGSNPVSLEPNMTNSTTPRPPLDLPLQRRVFIDNSVSMHEQNIPRIRSGVVFNDGDGTVSILSLGAMCVEGWKVRFLLTHVVSLGATTDLLSCQQKPLYNPAGIEVVTHEILHNPLAFDPRGGPTTADHVRPLSSCPATLFRTFS
jgi:hypothetical protein